jgi:hypothetical protein
MPVLNPNQSYTFSHYFELRIDPIDLIEAKRGDLDYGFSQLTAEMIALDQWTDAPTLEQQPLLVGAVTVGDSWRFGTLDRTTQMITEDTGSYRVPEDLEPLLRRLIKVLCP